MLQHLADEGWTEAVDDDRLALLAQDGDLEAQEVLIRRYGPFVRARVRNYFIPGGDREDLVQEGLVGLLKAIRDFRPGFGSSFRSFADLCVTRQVITAVKTATRQKHAALNYYRSLDGPVLQEPDAPSLADRIPARESVEDVVANELEPHLRVLGNARRILSPYEFSVLRLYLAGLSYHEISSRLGKSLKSVDSAVFKVKLKLRRERDQVVA